MNITLKRIGMLSLLAAALLGACGVDPVEGVTAFSQEEAEFKRRMALSGRSVMVIATADKLGTVAPFRVIAASQMTRMVTEDDAESGVSIVDLQPAEDEAAGDQQRGGGEKAGGPESACRGQGDPGQSGGECDVHERQQSAVRVA